MRAGKLALLEILATDGLRSVVGLSRAEPQLLGALGTCVREGLVRVVRPGLRPTGYSRREIPTDVATLTSAGRVEAVRCLGRTALGASLTHEIEHRVGVGELRTRLRIPPDAWTSAIDLHVSRLIEAPRTPRRGLPDGLADINGMCLALEYDHGCYTEVQVRLKQQVFGRLAEHAVWAAPTARRAEWLRRLGCEQVLIVPLPLGVWEDRSGSPPRVGMLLGVPRH